MIIFKKVCKKYDTEDRFALEDINLRINQGEFVFIVGKSGAGKSTLMRLLLRETLPTSGILKVNSHNVSDIKNRDLPKYRSNVGIVFQDYKLLENKTVYENIAFALEIIQTSPSEIRDITPKILTMVGLRSKSHKYPQNLSGGEQQRVAIARAIINNPKILICDEPTGNLDPVTSQGIMNLLLEINKIGTTIIIATHDSKIVDQLNKRVISLSKGRITNDKIGGYYH